MLYDSYQGGLKPDPSARNFDLPDHENDADSALVSLLVWGEHCTECAMPACYSSCELYNPRLDLHCNRFRGNSFVPAQSGTSTWLRVRFGKWAQLQATGPVTMFSRTLISRIERCDRVLSRLINWLPAPYGFKTKLANWWTRKKPHAYSRLSRWDIRTAKSFSLEAVNLGGSPVALIVSVWSQRTPTKMFQSRFDIKSGYSSHSVDASAFAARCSPGESLKIALTLDEKDTGAELLLRNVGLTTRETAHGVSRPHYTSEKPAKCVVWDLDNTLWDGTLIEDGVSGVRLRANVVRVIRELDRRGILNSIASKNNESDALDALTRFGILDLFLYPQVSWNPKSQAIESIQRALNIGFDTIVFIDDQVFERSEVAARFPEVMVLSDAEAGFLAGHKRFDVPVTEDSGKRRAFYQSQITRESASASFTEYEEFLRSCEIHLHVETLSDSRVDRVHELAQRTNQMNFSGNRYSRAEIQAMVGDSDKLTFVMSCRDRFGEYGVIGFGIISLSEQCLIDLMFSCRIQSKRIEHAFLTEVAKRMFALGWNNLNAVYRKTDRNLAAGRVFWDLGFTERIDLCNDSQLLTLNLQAAKLSEPLVTVTFDDNE